MASGKPGPGPGRYTTIPLRPARRAPTPDGGRQRQWVGPTRPPPDFRRCTLGNREKGSDRSAGVRVHPGSDSPQETRGPKLAVFGSDDVAMVASWFTVGLVTSLTVTST